MSLFCDYVNLGHKNGIILIYYETPLPPLFLSPFLSKPYKKNSELRKSLIYFSFFISHPQKNVIISFSFVQNDSGYRFQLPSH